MNIKSKAKMGFASLLALTTLLGSPLAAYAGYAPANRPTFQCTTPTNCPGANYVVFNSFTNAPNYGDERAFFDGKDATISAQGGWQDNVPVHDGERVALRVYIHNDANPNAIGVAAATAHNTSLQVILPSSVKSSNEAAAMVRASNANPGTVGDTVDFTGAAPFSIAFDKSAPVQISYRPNGTGGYVIRNVPNASFSNDWTMNASFGDWNGCFNYSALVTMIVVVHMQQQPKQPAYSCDAFNITSDVNRNVKVSSFSTTQTNGAVFNNATVNWGDNSADLTATNIVGATHHYAKDGTYTIQATAHFTVNGNQVSSDGPSCAKQVSFKHNVPPTVKPPTTPQTPGTLVNTGPGQVAGMFGAATAAGYAAYQWLLRRKLGRQ